MTDWHWEWRGAKAFGRQQGAFRTELAEEFASFYVERKLDGATGSLEQLYFDWLRKEFGDTRYEKGRAKADAASNRVTFNEELDSINFKLIETSESLLENEVIHEKDLDPIRFFRNHRFFRPKLIIKPVEEVPVEEIPIPPKPFYLAYIRCIDCFRLVWSRCFWCEDEYYLKKIINKLAE